MIKNIVLKFVYLTIILSNLVACKDISNLPNSELHAGKYWGDLTVEQVSSNSFDLKWDRAINGYYDDEDLITTSIPPDITYNIYLSTEIVDNNSIQTFSNLYSKEIDIDYVRIEGLEAKTIYFYCVVAESKNGEKATYKLGSVQTLTVDGSDPDNDDDTIDKAGFILTNGESITGEFNGEYDKDYYKFNVKSGNLYKISQTSNNWGFFILDENEDINYGAGFLHSNEGQSFFYSSHDGILYLRAYTNAFGGIHTFQYSFSIIEEESIYINPGEEVTETSILSNKSKTYFTENSHNGMFLFSWEYKNPEDRYNIDFRIFNHDEDHTKWSLTSSPLLIVPNKYKKNLFIKLESFNETDSVKFKLEPVLNPKFKTLIKSDWVIGEITTEDYILYSVEVKEKGTSYDIYWDDKLIGSDQYTADIEVSCYGEKEYNAFFRDVADAYSWPKQIIVWDETSIILVIKKEEETSGGTFAIKIEESNN